MDVEAPANVLLLVPSADPRGDEACGHLSTPTSPDAVDVLWVTLTQSPDDRLTRFRRHGDAVIPARAAIIDAGDEIRSASASVRTTGTAAEAPVSIDVVSSPGNLTELGVAITNTLSEWSGDGNQSVVCFHSITAMLQYAEVPQVFQFLHVMTQLVRTEDVIAHYHMDPTAHDERTVNTIKSLFDVIVEPGNEREAARSTADRSTGSPEADSDPRSKDLVDSPDGVAAGDHRTQYADGEPPSQAIVRAIATVEGVAPETLDSPLYEWVEPDALDSMLSQSAGSNVGSVRVEFVFGEYIVVADRETVTVRRTGPSVD